MDALNEWLGLIGTLLALGAIVYSWLTSRSKANSKRLDTAETTISDHHTQLALIEVQLEQLPNKDMVHALTLAMEKIDGSVSVMGEKVRGMDHTITSMDRYLRRGASK